MGSQHEEPGNALREQARYMYKEQCIPSPGCRRIFCDFITISDAKVTFLKISEFKLFVLNCNQNDEINVCVSAHEKG